MFSVKRLLQGLNERGALEISGEHGGPSHRLQNKPMQAGRRDDGKYQQRMAEASEHGGNFGNTSLCVKGARYQGLDATGWLQSYKNVPTRPILIAEDNADDIFLLRRAFTKSGVLNPVEIVSDGQEAIDFLEKRSPRKPANFPRLMLLDIKMPMMNGFDVLKWVRKQPGLKRLPIVIFSSSDEDSDVNRAYDLGANSYLVKPSNLETLQAVVKKLRDYWLEINLDPDCSKT